jgi:aspartyl-tRNA(Asn)/glutamyl-tRNA(Gln) amidotransferase subunit B
MNIDFETVIGLEVHLQLKTATKIFCGCANVFGSAPNTNTCPVCLGLPGALPVFNRKVLEYGIRIGLALGCEINPYIKFDRKNYYYPDLPKAYQISQYDKPVARNGRLMIPSGDGMKEIRINRAHLEEDAGKLIHDHENRCSLVDYNRTGTPLMEIVTEPDLRSPQEAYDYLQILKLTLQYLDVSDCDMEKGSLRCDANISIRPKGETKLGTKTELKNMNSFKAVKAALEYEVNRHKAVILGGEKIVQQTLLWDENKGVTNPMRSKEEAHDYRYFPDPDLVPFTVERKEIDAAKQDLPELPSAKLERLIRQYAISEYDARILIQDRHFAGFFEECTAQYKDVKKICNWMSGPVLKEMNDRKKNIDELGVEPQDLAALLQKIDEGVLSNLRAKDVLTEMIDSGKKIDVIIEEKGLAQVSDDAELRQIVDEIINSNAAVVEQFRAGNEKSVGFLVGQAMKKTGGKANPKKINELIRKAISG